MRILDRPPCRPELQPCAPLWNLVKDETCNQVLANVGELRAPMKAPRRRYWENPQSGLRLSGRAWFLAQLNATRKTPVSVYFKQMV